MGTINDRISRVLEDSGLTQTKFAERIHVVQSHISGLRSGAKKPTDRVIADICREFNVSELWLRTGEGEMYVKRNRNEEIAMLINELMREEDTSFRKRFVAAMLEIPPEFWPELERFFKRLREQFEEPTC